MSASKERTDIGFQAVQAIAELWQIEDDRVIWLANGFDWWPGHYRVRVLISDGFGEDSETNYKLVVGTDFVTGVKYGASKTNLGLQLLQSLSPSFAPRFIPEEIKRDWDMSDHESDIGLESAVYIREDNIAWMPRFFSDMVILQPIEAQSQAQNLAKFMEAKPNQSGINGGRLLPPDEILGVYGQIYVSAGQEASRWSDTDEFEYALEYLKQSGLVFGSVDSKGLTFEVAFGNDTAMIRFHTGQAHPKLGNGLLVTLQLPVPAEEGDVLTPSWYNIFELTGTTYTPLLGSWSLHEAPGRSFTLSHSTFVPNALHTNGLVVNFALWMMGRVQFVKDTLFKDLEDRPILETMEERYSSFKDLK